VLFPLLWSFRSDRSNTTIVPPLLHFRRGDSRFTAVVPLWFSSSNAARGTAWQLFFPFFLSRTGEAGRSRSWLTPLGGYRRDDDEGSRALTFLIPPLIWRRDSQREFETYLLLYWRYKDLIGQSTTTVIGPLYRHDDPTGSTRAGLPLFWYFRDAASGATAHTFFPLYFRRSSAEESTTAAGLFPAWFYFRRFSDGYSFGLSPLAFFGSRGDRRHALLLPVLYHFKDARSSATVAFPLFYRFTDAQHETTGVPLLLYFQGRDHGDSYRVQFPAFWRFRDAEAGATTTVVPPVFYRSRPDGWSAGLAPLLFAGGGGPRRHFVLFPLFWHFRDDTRDSTSVVALNYLHRRRGNEVTDALFPLLHYRRGAKPGGSDETSFTLLPLLHYRRDAHTKVLITPLGGFGHGGDRRFGLVGPYFWYGSRALAMRGVPPLYLEVAHPATGERTRIIGPWFQMDAPGSGARVLFPLAARYWDTKDSGTYVFPTYFHRRTADGYTLDTVLPLFWISRAPGHSNTVVGPFFRRTFPGGGSVGLIPLFIHARNQERRLLVTPLFVHHESYRDGVARTFAPLVFRSSRPEGSNTVVFPFWWSGRDKDRSHQVLFPLFWRFANQRDDSDWTLAGPLYWSRTGPWRTRGLMPVAWYSSNGQGSGSEAVLPLFYEKHSPSDRLVLTVPFGFRSAPDSGWFYLGPFVYKDGWDKSFWTLFPLAFSHYDKVTETRTRVVPPLLLYHRQSPDRSLFGMLMLFWRHRDITSTTTLGLPLFYDFNSFHDRRLTMLLPLFVRYRNQVTDTSISVAPFFYRRTGPTDSTTVAFPLVWDFRGGDRRSTLVFPFYAGFRRPNWEGRYIFPNIWYSTGRGPDGGTSRLLILPFWESRVKRPGDYLWEALLGLFGWERIGRNRYLKILFIPFELSPAPAASTAWYGKPPPLSRRDRWRGLSTQTW
jgi:hypothetical protein